MVKSLLISCLMLLAPLALSQASDGRSASRDFRTANQLFASSQFRDALSLYQKLLVSPPADVPAGDIQVRIGDSFFRLGYFKNAVEAYRGAIGLQKESARPETQYWIGFCCFLLGKDAEAVDEFLKIPRLYPGSGMWINTAYYWAARASERMGKKDEAAAYYRKAGGSGRSTQGRFALKKAQSLKNPKQAADFR